MDAETIMSKKNIFINNFDLLSMSQIIHQKLIYEYTNTIPNKI